LPYIYVLCCCLELRQHKDNLNRQRRQIKHSRPRFPQPPERHFHLHIIPQPQVFQCQHCWSSVLTNASICLPFCLLFTGRATTKIRLTRHGRGFRISLLGNPRCGGWRARNKCLKPNRCDRFSLPACTDCFRNYLHAVDAQNARNYFLLLSKSNNNSIRGCLDDFSQRIFWIFDGLLSDNVASGQFISSTDDSGVNNQGYRIKIPSGSSTSKASLCSERVVICSRFNSVAPDLHNYATFRLFTAFYLLLRLISGVFIWKEKSKNLNTRRRTIQKSLKP